MRSLLVKAIATSAALMTVTSASSATAESRVVWEGAGWRVLALTTPQGTDSCLATTTFASRVNDSEAITWGFINSSDGRWQLLVGGPSTAVLVGKPVTVHVGSQLIYGTTPKALSKTLVSFGELSQASVKAIADGHVLRIASTFGNATFPLKGSHDALTAARLCTSMSSRSSHAVQAQTPSSATTVRSQQHDSSRRYRINDISPDAFLNLRTGPSTKFPIAAVIPQGATFEVTGTCGAIASRAVWCPVRYAGITGWTHGGGIVEVPQEGPPPQQQMRRNQQEASVASPPKQQPPPPHREASRDDEKDEDRTTVSTGTGFFVSTSGHILTNAHVIKSCKAKIGVRLHSDGRFRMTRVIAADAASDLALLKLEAEPSGVAIAAPMPWRRDVRLGEPINIFGFPHIDTLSTSGSFTRGDVTSVAGLDDNIAHFQLSAPVQPGNSGGPVVDAHGNVVGVVVAKLNAIAMIKKSGDIPQNVNFAVKSSHAASFLEVHGVQPIVASATATGDKMSGPDVAERLRHASVLIMCFT